MSGHRMSFSNSTAQPASPSAQILTFSTSATGQSSTNASGRQSRSNSVHAVPSRAGSIHHNPYMKHPPSSSSTRTNPLRSPAFMVLVLVNLTCLLWWRSHDDGTRASAQALEDAYEAGFRARQMADRASRHTNETRLSQFDRDENDDDSRVPASYAAGSRRKPKPISSMSTSHHGHHGAIASTLKAQSIHEASLQTCEICVRDPNDSMCQEYGLDNVRLSRAYQGSGTRVRSFLEKALKGQHVKIGVIGGSVSAGHGVRGDKWWERWFRSFNDAFSKSDIYNGALPAMDSDFYSFCFATAVPEDMDLYIVELDINNLNTPDTYKADDALFRALLSLPQQPAVIRTSFVATSFPDLVMGYASNLLLSTYFDVPVISIRNFMLPHFISHPEESAQFFDFFPDLKPDYRHMAQLGHDVMADMFSLYLREQTCEVKRRLAAPPKEASGVWPKSDILTTLPRLYLWEPFSKHKKVQDVTPQCRFAGSTKKPLEPFKGDSSQTTPESWQLSEWNGKSAWRSNKPGSRISFQTKGTEVGLHIYKRHADDQGKLECWTDGHETRRKVIDAWFEEQASRPVWELVGWKLRSGDQLTHDHKNLAIPRSILTCEVSQDTSTEGHEVRIISVASR
ncbi:hypothetical protein OIO90_003553 [Microbotryomycetes sp. JL221]|nr:hypothetical protein OIO90_003553 [Microbotryomycetes sp. JL221]